MAGALKIYMGKENNVESYQLKKYLVITLRLYALWVLIFQIYTAALYNIIINITYIFGGLGLYAICVILLNVSSVYLAIYSLRNASSISDNNRFFYTDPDIIKILMRVRLLAGMVFVLEVIGRVLAFLNTGTLDASNHGSLLLIVLPVALPLTMLVLVMASLRKQEFYKRNS